MNTKNISWLAATALWLVNPVYSGCDSSDDDEFDFGEAELLDILDEVNTQSWETTFDGELSTITVELTQVVADGEVEEDHAYLWSIIELGTAYACDSRNFVAAAEACIDVSSLPVQGTLTISSNLEVESEPQIFDVSGSLDVFGKILDNAELWLRSDDIQANWNARFNEEGQLEVIGLGYIE